MATKGRGVIEDLDQEAVDLCSSLAEADTTLIAEDDEDLPRDTPLAAEDYGTTGAEEARDEPLTERLRRDVPEVSAGHRPVDPDRLAATAFPGRLVSDDGPQVAEGDTGGFTAEESAVHLVPQPRAQATPKVGSRGDRLDLLEAQMTVLLTMVRVLTEAAGTLAEGLERLPTEEPGEAASKVSLAARNAHHLLLALREVPA